MAGQLQPVDEAPVRATTAAELAQKIASLIRRRRIGPGEPLREQFFADRYGVSRGPVREAFRLLEAAGLVRAEPMRGVTVTRLSQGELIVSSEISASLHGICSKRMAEVATDEEIAEFNRRVAVFSALIESDVSLDRFIVASIRLGDYMFVCSRSRLLIDQMRNVYIYGPASAYAPYALSSKRARERTVKAWQRLAELMSVRDGDRAENAARRLHRIGLQEALMQMGRDGTRL